MTLYEFNTLPDFDKGKVIFSMGEFIHSINEGNTRTALYAINRFYVEVVYDSSENKITRFNSFKTGFLLDKYSESINFS
ncbi:hypothetical protein [Aquimarina macrocephali]|uniref:hypothetical protein n=1 Tax=Aquimarina macrocephali TaxID=666563 RepID=UPI003F668FC1